MNYLVMGPWFHSQINREGRSLGTLTWATDTAAQWRREVLLPFFNQYLKPGSPRAATPPVFIYDTGADHWDTPKIFPASCETGLPGDLEAALSRPRVVGFRLMSQRKGSAAKFDDYVSDPAKPVPTGLVRSLTATKWAGAPGW